MKRIALTMGLAAALCGSAAAEQFFKWQDDNGTWHYTTVAPKDKQATQVIVSAGAARTVQTEGEGAAAAAGGDPAATAPKPGETVVATADTVKRQAEAQKARTENCERAKTNASTIESYASVTVQRDGADVKLNEEERLAELKRARQQVELYCK